MKYRGTIACFFLFVIVVSLPVGAREIILSTGGDGSVAFLDTDRFGSACAGRLGGVVGSCYGFREKKEEFSLSPTFTLSYFGSSRSTVTDNIVIYRGFYALRLALGLDFSIPPIPIMMNIAVGTNIAKYTDTANYFFFPDLQCMFFREINALSRKKSTWDIGLPIRLSLRNDMDVDLSAGIAFRLNLFLF
ncbi:hypothetical protein [Sediminispirochaeta bajacaliforniensis]|uniref:hypothetical protein n=1 Tax=Sediminispirochaeta bajacaliforniensis TaxID=148 RepID=UPI00036A976B|nr:hypothetical protein [Sediminispirochaeta bajacaliforniensis]